MSARLTQNVPVMEVGDTNPFFMVPVSVIAGGGGTSEVDESSFTVGTTPGTPIMGVVDPSDTPSDGSLAVVALDNARRLKVSGSFSSTPVQSNTVTSPGPVTVGASSVQLLAANSSRKRLILQNVGTTKIWVLLGAGSASSVNYHIALPAGGTANDGSSEPYIDTMWTGAIQAISSAAGGSVQALEFT